MHDRVQGGGRRCEDLCRAAPVVAQLGGAVGNAQELRGAESSRRAVGELEVEPPADRDDQVRIAHHRSAHGGHHRRMVVGDQPATLAGVEVHRAPLFGTPK
jgi:hypothetical protein